MISERREKPAVAKPLKDKAPIVRYNPVFLKVLEPLDCAMQIALWRAEVARSKVQLDWRGF